MVAFVTRTARSPSLTTPALSRRVPSSNRNCATDASSRSGAADGSSRARRGRPAARRHEREKHHHAEQHPARRAAHECAGVAPPSYSDRSRLPVPARPRRELCDRPPPGVHAARPTRTDAPGSAVISYMRYGARMTDDYLGRIGNLIRDARKHRGLTQQQLADVPRHQPERGQPDREAATRTSPWRCSPASARRSTPRSSRSAPARRTCGSPAPPRCPAAIDVKTSKNAGVALLCASLLNRGPTTLRKVARIEEVNRLLEVLDSIGRADPLAQRRQRPRDRPAARSST